MKWAIIFVISWVLFFIFIDLRRLKENLIGGILAVGLATFVDNGAQSLRLYEFNDMLISWAGLPVFYIWGPIFTMGILFVQFVPQYKWLQALHVLVFSLTFAAVDFLSVQVGAAVYLHWHWLASFFVNSVTFGSLTWITQAFIRKRT